MSIKSEIDEAVRRVLETSAFIGGRFVDAFEGSFAAFCGAKHCIGVANGTDAIFITLKCLGIGAGDEVIVPANSFIATSEAVTLTGARVVFCDIDPRTYNIDPERIAALVTPRTRAIICVHLYGQPADMDPILETARRYKLLVIEDAAQAHGAMYKGRSIGSIGDATTFSFYPGKNLGAYGDGGAIVTSDSALAEKIRMFANHGRIDKYNHGVEGVNSRLDGLQAAILSVKLKHLESWNELRRGHARRYSELLARTDVVTPTEQDGTTHVYHLFVIRVAAGSRDALRAFLQDRNVSAGIHYPIALPNLAAYAYLEHGPNDFPEAMRASGDILSLPIFPEMTDAQIEYVCDSVAQFDARVQAVSCSS